MSRNHMATGQAEKRLPIAVQSSRKKQNLFNVLGPITGYVSVFREGIIRYLAHESGLGDITGYPAFASGVKSVNVT